MCFAAKQLFFIQVHKYSSHIALSHLAIALKTQLYTWQYTYVYHVQWPSLLSIAQS